MKIYLLVTLLQTSFCIAAEDAPMLYTVGKWNDSSYYPHLEKNGFLFYSIKFTYAQDNPNVNEIIVWKNKIGESWQTFDTNILRINKLYDLIDRGNKDHKSDFFRLLSNAYGFSPSQQYRLIDDEKFQGLNLLKAQITYLNDQIGAVRGENTYVFHYITGDRKIFKLEVTLSNDSISNVSLCEINKFIK